ncbi:MAG TPA: cytochrome c oxidase subunit II [Gemmataceae bacterium]|nr:cytochrome c oxidase subunit II [Gemmataceae bacterium]
MQKFWGLLFGGTMAGALLLFIVSPFVGWWLPKNVATFGAGIDNLFYVILAITGFFFILTEAILVYNMFRFAAKPGRKASYTHGNHTLEIVWTLVPGVILLVLAIVQIKVWAEVKFQKSMPQPNDPTTQQMEVLARQWEWRVRYPNRERMASWENNENLARDFGQNPHVDDLHITNEIHVWTGVRVLVHLKTQDVIHSFFLPNLRLKQDALPGKTIPVWFAVTESNVEPQIDPKTHERRWFESGYDPATGKTTDASKIWELACAEFCGTRHSMMRGKLYVHKDKADFLEWLKQAEAEQDRHHPQAPVQVAGR